MSAADDFDSDDDFDPTDESDPEIRELRLEIVRLEARIDQLAAAERERAAEMDELRLMMDDLSRRIAALEAFRKQYGRRMIAIGLCAAMIGTAVAQVVIGIWFP